MISHDGASSCISASDGLIRACAWHDEETARLMTIPGFGPITALSFQAFAPPMESFRRGRDLSAWRRDNIRPVASRCLKRGAEDKKFPTMIGPGWVIVGQDSFPISAVFRRRS